MKNLSKKLAILLAFTLLLGILPNAQAAPKPNWASFQRVTDKTSVPEVAAIQYLLKARGYYSYKVDGIFGFQTEKAVRAFQKAARLKVDGIAGPQTLAKLVVPLKRGAKGDSVRALQTALNTIIADSEVLNNNPIKVDGIFGAQTEAMVRAFQSVVELKQDGVVGPQTWCVLLGGSAGGD